ncbi:MAG: hypothetical protein AB1480_01245 [Nitrospirota bacterium]
MSKVNGILNSFIVILGICSLILLASCTTVKTIAGTGTSGCADGPGLAATLSSPVGLVTDPWQNIYVADSNCNKIRQIVHGPNNVTPFAGTGTAGCDDGNVLTTATFRTPVDVARDNAGNYYIADQANHVIRKITPAGLVTTIAGQCRKALTAPKECQNDKEPCSVSTPVPESISPPTEALFYSPSAVVVDSEGNILVADWGTCSVRKIDLKGNVTTVGKKGGKKVSASVGCCTCSGPFSYPSGIDIDAAGNIYVSEYYGHKISRIDAVTEDITTWAGGSWGYKDGPGSDAAFMYPYHIVIDKASGETYVADHGNNRIRYETPRDDLVAPIAR